MYLVGDIGGTKTNIIALENLDVKFSPVFEKSFISKNYDSLKSIVKEIIDQHKFKIKGACFGVAGPVKNGRCEATNLPWIIDVKNIAEVASTEQANIHLLNDLEAAAYGIECLEEKDFCTLNKGTQEVGGTRCLISAGTGLGESIIVWNGTLYKPIPTEGGHTDFAPRNKIEINLLDQLITKYGRVSYERILCGPGLLNVYDFFTGYYNKETPKWLKERLQSEDPSAVISEIGMSKKDECCEKALDLFVSIYGAEAGNLALKSLATGGVYVGGGIAPKILNKIKEGAFIQSFTHKGRLSVMIAQMPVKVILNNNHPLLGCVNYLRQVLSKSLIPR